MTTSNHLVSIIPTFSTNKKENESELTDFENSSLDTSQKSFFQL